MRLFIAINLEEKLKEVFLNKIDLLKEKSSSGRFSSEENLHITLAFIGETEDVSGVEAAMDKVSLQKFEIVFGNMGKFVRKSGDIYFIGIKKNRNLYSLYRQLNTALIEEGFPTDKREFTPHLTLGRNIVLKNKRDFDEYLKKSMGETELKMNVGKISLMKSEIKDGRIRYTEIYSVNLKD